MSCLVPVTSTLSVSLAQLDVSSILAAMQSQSFATSLLNNFSTVPTSQMNTELLVQLRDLALQQSIPTIQLPVADPDPVPTPCSSLSSMTPMPYSSLSPLGLTAQPLPSTGISNSPNMPTRTLPSTSGLLSPQQLPQPMEPYMSQMEMDVHFFEGPSTSRRQSAPEHHIFLRPPVPEKRRYSDFSISSLLKAPGHTAANSQHRRNSSGRKQRTIYGQKQTEVLEEAFNSQRYMVGTEREMLASRLGLTEAQVRVWFQNRRSKMRKLTKLGEAEARHQM